MPRGAMTPHPPGRAGPIGDGGKVWCLYGQSVPLTWAEMIGEFTEDALRLAVRLVPVPEDLPNREQWPTSIYARKQAANGAA